MQRRHSPTSPRSAGERPLLDALLPTLQGSIGCLSRLANHCLRIPVKPSGMGAKHMWHSRQYLYFPCSVIPPGQIVHT